MSYSEDRFREKLLKKLDVQNELLKELVKVLSPTKPYYIQDKKEQEPQEAPIEITSKDAFENWAREMLDSPDINYAIEHDEINCQTYLVLWETKLVESGETGTRRKLYFPLRPGQVCYEEV